MVITSGPCGKVKWTMLVKPKEPCGTVMSSEPCGKVK